MLTVLTDTQRPEVVSLSGGQHDLVLYSMVVAGFALFAQFVRTWVSTSEVGPRYRSALHASLSISGVAFLAYVYLALKFDSAYVLSPSGLYRPTAEALETIAPRYMDWSVTVPLLMVELIAVSALSGARARVTRLVAVASAFLMIVTGYLGAFVVVGGTSTGWMLFWGVVSTVFYAVLYVVVVGTLLRSRSSMGSQPYASLRNATVLLLSVWGVYPLAFAVHQHLHGPGWTTTIQVAFSAADVAAKVGFGALLHKVAKLRTAEDATAGLDTHPESVWVSGVQHSGALTPVVAATPPAHHAPEHHAPEHHAPASGRPTTPPPAPPAP